MVYLLETELSKRKSIFFALTNVYGIGKSKSNFICKKLGFTINLKVFELSNEHIIKLLKLIETANIILNNDLKKLQITFIKKLIIIKSYRGLRKIKGLPIRGQRTHTNARTAKRIKK